MRRSGRRLGQTLGALLLLVFLLWLVAPPEPVGTDVSFDPAVLRGDPPACLAAQEAAMPFDDDGALDLDSGDRLVDFDLGTGVSGMTILGIMGEAQKLSPDEAVTFARRVIGRIDGRVPVIVGVSAAGLGRCGRWRPR